MSVWSIGKPRTVTPRQRRRLDRHTGTIADLARSKDIRRHPGFRTATSRFLWRVWFGRLTPSGQYLLLITGLFMALGSNAMLTQAYAPVTYFCALWALAFAWVLVCKPGLKINAAHTDRMRAGELMTVDLHVTQLKRFTRPEINILPFGLPPGLDAEPLDGASLPVLKRGETAAVTLGIRCSRRGVYRWGGFRAETDFPFGIIRAFTNYPHGETIAVYPKFTPLESLEVPIGKRYQPGGVAMASDLGESFEYIGNRDYREGDSVRSIDWRATARLNTPIVREYRDEYFLRVGVVLDTHVPAIPGANEGFEAAISACAAAADYMARADYLVDLFAAGPDLYHLTAGRSLAYLDQILEILACVNPGTEEQFDALEPALSEHLSLLTSIICVFTDWTESRRNFVHRLASEGAGVKVIVVKDGQVSLPLSSADMISPIVHITSADIARGVRVL
jgi:uncharacterized protein (DUF58 family)